MAKKTLNIVESAYRRFPKTRPTTEFRTLRFHSR